MELAHPAQRVDASDTHVHLPVRCNLEPAQRSLTVIPTSFGPPKPRGEKLVFGVRVQIDRGPAEVPYRHRVASVNDQRVQLAPLVNVGHPLAHKQWIGIAGRHLRLPERWREPAYVLSLGITVVPVGEGPIIWAAEVCNRLAYDALEVVQVHPMPWEKEPAVVLALVPSGPPRPTAPR